MTKAKDLLTTRKRDEAMARARIMLDTAREWLLVARSNSQDEEESGEVSSLIQALSLLEDHRGKRISN